jgi:NADPH:quinone reductase-like Zn-dependent oxidoreductase
MHAAVLHAFGEAPKYEEFADPVAADGEEIVEVSAAALKPVDKQMAAGSHYASPKKLPAICGIDGVGRLSDGRRVFFAGVRPPYGTMAERAAVRSMFAFPIPDGLSDDLAAAIVNPGVSAWLTLAHRAKLAKGDNVLILGATGVTGKLAVGIAKLLGAARVVAAGRNRGVLATLHELGADATVELNQPADELSEKFAHEAGEAGFQVVIDYVWGAPAEAFLKAITRTEFAAAESEMRYVQVGESAGATISLPAAVLRSTPITIMGTAGIPDRGILADSLQKVLTYAADRKLRIETERVPLSEIEQAWNREQSGKRFVVVP